MSARLPLMQRIPNPSHNTTVAGSLFLAYLSGQKSYSQLLHSVGRADAWAKRSGAPVRLVWGFAALSRQPPHGRRGWPLCFSGLELAIWLGIIGETSGRLCGPPAVLPSVLVGHLQIDPHARLAFDQHLRRGTRGSGISGDLFLLDILASKRSRFYISLEDHHKLRVLYGLRSEVRDPKIAGPPQ